MLSILLLTSLKTNNMNTLLFVSLIIVCIPIIIIRIFAYTTKGLSSRKINALLIASCIGIAMFIFAFFN
jgi:hypothetical protein